MKRLALSVRNLQNDPGHLAGNSRPQPRPAASSGLSQPNISGSSYQSGWPERVTKCSYGFLYASGRLGDNHLQKVSSQTSFRFELGLSKASFHLQPFITIQTTCPLYCNDLSYTRSLLQSFGCFVLFIANMLFIANVALLYVAKSFFPSSMKT